MLARLGIRQKLSLLLTIPLIAVVLVMVPFMAERINDARAAAATARTASAARAIGGLIQTLQQERLLALGYLSTSTLDQSDLLAKSQEAVDELANLRRVPATSAVLDRAGPAVTDLDAIRQGVLDHTVAPTTAYVAYRAADLALLDALSLGRPVGVDAAGTSQLGALDALMRSNEEAASIGAVLVAATTVNSTLVRALADAQTADLQYLQRFRELVGPGQADLVDAVERGQARQRIRDLSARVNFAVEFSQPVAVEEALSLAVTYTDLRRLAQDRVAREIVSGADERSSSASTIAWGVSGGAGALLVIVVFLGVTVSSSISRPLRRLTRAAGVVAELSGAELLRVADSESLDPAPPRLAAVEVDSADEIGELATALNRVQATAALLLERQVSNRRNVSVMFANIARRTQNLVGRQLALIDDLERNERNPELLQRLYRLDHIATRLRRSADSLLVVSGTIDQQLSGAPSELAEIMRSALAEIEGFRAVELGEFCDVAVSASVAGDLRLLLAELLENATNFSPPGTGVDVTAVLDGDCEIRIVDRGVGLSAAKMAEENRRLVERERLDVAPTTVLGLFVVGRLARRHGLFVRLEATVDRGVTAVVQIPQRLLTVGPVPVGRGASAVRVRPARVARDMIDAIEVPQPYGSFPWFETSGGPAAITAVAAEPEAESEPESGPETEKGEFGSPIADPSYVVPVWGEPAPDHAPTPPRRVSAAPAGPPPAWPLAPSTTPSGGEPRVPAAALPTLPPTQPPSVVPGAVRPSPLAPSPLPQPVGATPLPRRGVAAAVSSTGDSLADDSGDIGRDGLSRRRPGTHMAEDVRDAAEEPTKTRPRRDPEAERAALNDYMTGVARSDDVTANQTSRSTLVERP